MAIVLTTLPTAGKLMKKTANPDEVFSALFEPVEAAMGVTIKAGKMKLNLLSGQVGISSLKLDHPQQGTFAKATGITFPFGALVGASDPLKAHTFIDTLTASVDFGGTRFWMVENPGGGPIPGAPALEMGNLTIRDGELTLFHGKSAHVSLEGFKGNLKRLKVPGKVWSQGKAPTGRWADITIQGGTFKMSGQPHGVNVEKASFHMQSRTFHVDSFDASPGSGGDVSLHGQVEMAGGRPSSYDLVAELASVHIDRPHLDATLDGRLTLKGKPGKLKVAGKLDLSDVVTLHAAKWTSPQCKSSLLLSVQLVPEKGSKFKKAKIKGSTCKGRIVLK
jgi:hypothetical protein